MTKQLKTLLLSLLTPGLGYFHKGYNHFFFRTIIVFFSLLTAGVVLRLFTTFRGVAGIVLSIISVYAFATIHAMMKAEDRSRRSKSNGLLKLCFTISFLFVTSLSFANRRTLMGFDVMSMDVPVMQPTLLQGDRFLVDTWINESQLKKGTIVVHSFSGQNGLYLNRIVAAAGDRIEIKNGLLNINGQVQPEPYVLSANVTRPESRNMKAVTIPKGHYFVMGDNRDASFGDSRFSGNITIVNIVAIPTDIISSQDKSRIGRSVH